MDRGQLYTLEGVVAGIVVLLSLLFILQATSVTPQSVRTAGPGDNGVQMTNVESALESLDYEELKQTVLYWDNESKAFHCTPGGYEFYPGYADTTACSPPVADAVPPTALGETLESDVQESDQFNINLAYSTASGDIERQRLLYQGEPGSGSVKLSRAVALHDNDKLRDDQGNRTNTAVSDSTANLYAPNSNPRRAVYNVVHVEVVVW